MKITILMTVETDDMPMPVFASAVMRMKRDFEDDLALHGGTVRITQVRKLASEPPKAESSKAEETPAPLGSRPQTRPETPAALGHLPKALPRMTIELASR